MQPMSSTPVINVPSTLLNAIFLFASNDDLYRKDLSSYFNQLLEAKVFSSLQYFAVDPLDSRKLTEVLPQTDLCFCLITVDFIDAFSKRQSMQHKLMDEHQLKRLRVVSLLLHDWPVDHTLFKTSIILPDRNKPILGGEWSHMYEAMQQSSEILFRECIQIRAYKDEITQAYEELQGSDDEIRYWAFLKKYGHSHLAKTVKKELDEMIEERLWQKASTTGSAEHYLEYLQSAPLRKHQLDAASILNNIEESEELIWKDTQQVARPEFFLRYKASFPKGKYVDFSTQEAARLLKDPLEYPKDDDAEDFQAYFLLRKAYEALKNRPSEIFAMESYLKYCLVLRGRVEQLVRDMNGKSFLFITYGVGVLLLEIMVYLLVRGPGAIDLSLDTNFLRNALFVLINVFFMYRVFRSLEHVKADLQFAQNAQEMMKRASVLLKASFISHDNQSVQKILHVMASVEDKMKAIRKKSFLSYLFEAPLLDQQAES
jgi:hypothetical protein